jgi:chromosome segregation ATPase
MENGLADTFLDFYQKILKPEFDTIKGKLAEHDERFSEVLGHLDSIYHRLGSLENEHLMITNRLKPIEGSIESVSAKRLDLGKRVHDIKEQLTVLQNRLASVERQLTA